MSKKRIIVKSVKKKDLNEFIDDEEKIIGLSMDNTELNGREIGSVELTGTAERKRPYPDIYKGGLYGPRGWSNIYESKKVNEERVLEDLFSKTEKEIVSISIIEEKNPLVIHKMRELYDELEQSDADTVISVLYHLLDETSKFDIPFEIKRKLKNKLYKTTNILADGK